MSGLRRRRERDKEVWDRVVSVGWRRESVEAVWDRGVMGQGEGWREGRVSQLWQREIYNGVTSIVITL